jgi:5-methyltetrahydropteroyltriglutamate--homocysteine methyltransferase
VNQKLPHVESVQEVLARAEKAVQLFCTDRVLLNPDCGFATFAANPIASSALATTKLAAVAVAARALRDRRRTPR